LVAGDYPPDFEALRIEIGGVWSAAEMASLLADLDRLYAIRMGLDTGPEIRRYWGELLPPRPWWPRPPWPWIFEVEERGRLDVLRIRYGSDGSLDITGAGKVLEQLRLFIEKLMDIRTTRRRQRLEDAKLEEEIRAQKIENARNMTRLVGEAREVGLGDDDLRYLLYEVDSIQERLDRQIERGKITGIGPAPDGGEAVEADAPSL
jgi:hypothetical protein